MNQLTVYYVLVIALKPEILILMTNFYAESSIICKILGALFYYRPTDYNHYGIDRVLSYQQVSDHQFSDQTDSGSPSELLHQFQAVLTEFRHSDPEILSQIHDSFFVGISEMPVPPWGSVYLDRECVLFGESTTQYKQYLTQIGVEFETHNNDPLDHIGLMLMVLGEVLEAQLEQDDKTDLHTLLGFHLLPWVIHYLTQITQYIPVGAYASLVRFTQSLLNQLQREFNVKVEMRKVYFNVNTI